MATAADLIRRSLKLLGVVAAGEPVTSEDEADALVELNHLTKSWANERLMAFGTSATTELGVNGGQGGPGDPAYTSLLSGAFVRPSRIDAIGFKPLGVAPEVSVSLLTDAEYQAVSDKEALGSIPSGAWVDWGGLGGPSNIAILLTPVPSASGTLVLYVWNTVPVYTLVSTINLPDGYENALAHALAIQMAPMFGVEPSPSLQNNALMAVTAIKRINMQPSLLRCDGVSGSRFNLVSGDS